MRPTINTELDVRAFEKPVTGPLLVELVMDDGQVMVSSMTGERHEIHIPLEAVPRLRRFVGCIVRHGA